MTSRPDPARLHVSSKGLRSKPSTLAMLTSANCLVVTAETKGQQLRAFLLEPDVIAPRGRRMMEVASRPCSGPGRSARARPCVSAADEQPGAVSAG